MSSFQGWETLVNEANKIENAFWLSLPMFILLKSTQRGLLNADQKRWDMQSKSKRTKKKILKIIVTMSPTSIK